MPRPQTTDEPELEYLSNCRSFYSCICCRTHLADHDQLISRTFHGSHGRACLFKSVVNVKSGIIVDRDLITGPHLVADISCSRCQTVVGWKYEKAQYESQKYKEGKFVIELAHVIRENRHLELDNGDKFFGNPNYYKSVSSTIASSSSPSTSHSCQSTPTRVSTISSYCRDSGGLEEEDEAVGSSQETGASIDDHCNAGTSKSKPLDIIKHRQQSNRRLSHNVNSMINFPGSPSETANNTPEFDEDLLFVFYDDWCASKSNYPSSLSWSHYDRKRRSLYKNSKPYDWKFQSSSVSPPELSAMSPESSSSRQETSELSTNGDVLADIKADSQLNLAVQLDDAGINRI